MRPSSRLTPSVALLLIFTVGIAHGQQRVRFPSSVAQAPGATYVPPGQFPQNPEVYVMPSAAPPAGAYAVPGTMGQPAPGGYAVPAMQPHLPPAFGNAPAQCPSSVGNPSFGLTPSPWNPYAPAVAPAGLAPVGMALPCYEGLEAGADVIFFRPYLGNIRSATYAFPAAPPVVYTATFPRNQYEPSPRLWLGYVFSSGLGFRARYWEFDHTLASETGTFEFPLDGLPPEVAGTTITSRGRLVARTLDGEVSQQLDVGPWRTRVGGGIRYAEFQRRWMATVDFPLFFPIELDESDRFFGVGPTLFAELRRPLGDSGFALVANGRGTLLFGSRIDETGQSLAFVDYGDVLEVHRDVPMSVGEIQLGVEWANRSPVGASLFVRAMWEAQVWSAMGNPLGSEAAAGLQGFSLGVGVQR